MLMVLSHCRACHLKTDGNSEIQSNVQIDTFPPEWSTRTSVAIFCKNFLAMHSTTISNFLLGLSHLHRSILQQCYAIMEVEMLVSKDDESHGKPMTKPLCIRRSTILSREHCQRLFIAKVFRWTFVFQTDHPVQIIMIAEFVCPTCKSHRLDTGKIAINTFNITNSV